MLGYTEDQGSRVTRTAMRARDFTGRLYACVFKIGKTQRWSRRGFSNERLAMSQGSRRSNVVRQKLKPSSPLGR